MMVGSGEERINKPIAGCDASDDDCVAGLLLLLAHMEATGAGSTAGIHYRNQILSLASRFAIRGQKQPNWK